MSVSPHRMSNRGYLDRVASVDPDDTEPSPALGWKLDAAAMARQTSRSQAETAATLRAFAAEARKTAGALRARAAERRSQRAKERQAAAQKRRIARQERL